ncbi:hypothetical protein STEG23_023742, partial [Scotinomys teguina]
MASGDGSMVAGLGGTPEQFFYRVVHLRGFEKTDSEDTEGIPQPLISCVPLCGKDKFSVSLNLQSCSSQQGDSGEIEELVRFHSSLFQKDVHPEVQDNRTQRKTRDKSKELSRAPRSPALMLRAPERKTLTADKEDKEPPPMLVRGEDTAAKGNKPVASTPVPGSPWCVVWTGDDRVFFFNPTMQLSVWEKPVDLKNRGDLKRIIEDPPHKRKLEASA